jgi:hypothetical protein
MGYNKKRVVLLLDVVNIQKIWNQNRIANRFSVGVTRFVMMIASFVTKYVGIVCCFMQNEKEEEEMREEERRVVCQDIT